MYAIGGSENPIINSEGNRFFAPDSKVKKQVDFLLVLDFRNQSRLSNAFHNKVRGMEPLTCLRILRNESNLCEGTEYEILCRSPSASKTEATRTKTVGTGDPQVTCS